MFAASRAIKSMTPKQTILIEGKDGTTTNPQDCADILTEHFKNNFQDPNAKPIKDIKPMPMKTPFNAAEVEQAALSMKNDRKCGCDLIKPELVKYGTTAIFQGIATILNKTAEQGKPPKELKK